MMYHLKKKTKLPTKMRRRLKKFQKRKVNPPNQRNKKYMWINTTKKKRITVRNSTMKRKWMIIKRTTESKFMLMQIQMYKSNSKINQKKKAKRMENIIKKAKKKMLISNTLRLSTIITAAILMIKQKA